MFLSVDIGNTNITFGCLNEKGQISCVGRVSTDRRAGTDEYASSLKNILELKGTQLSCINGSIITYICITGHRNSTGTQINSSTIDTCTI